MEHWARSFRAAVTNLKHFNPMVDLFEYPELWPANLRVILARYMAKDPSYTNLIRLENELLKIGYSFEFGLDCVAYNLQKIDGVKKAVLRRLNFR